MALRLFPDSFFMCIWFLPNQIVGFKDQGFLSFISYSFHYSFLRYTIKIVFAFVDLFETDLL